MKGPAMGLFSWLVSSSDKSDREASAGEGATAKGKGTRKERWDEVLPGLSA